MKTRTIYLTSTLLLTAGAQAAADSAADELNLFYANPIGSARLTVDQDIRVGKRDMRASRDFRLELEFAMADAKIPVTVNKAKASYTAHGMTQRLPTSKLIGQDLALAIAGDGTSLSRSEPVRDLEIPVGDIIAGDYPIGLALADIMPVLPATPVSVGTTWTSTHTTQTLEGWAWAQGSLHNEHRVTAIDNDGGHVVVSVHSTASGKLGNAGRGLRYGEGGTLERTSDWRFDASDGRILSLSMMQTTSGFNSLPQGELKVDQRTKIEFSTSE
jgi:hypothetical protein